MSYPKNTTGNLFTTENAEISDDFWKRRTQLYFSYHKRAFFIKALKYRRFGNVSVIICWHRIVFGLSKLHKFRLAVHVSGETLKADFFHCRRDFVVVVSDAVGAVCVAAERDFPSAEFVVSFQDVDVGD